MNRSDIAWQNIQDNIVHWDEEKHDERLQLLVWQLVLYLQAKREEETKTEKTK